MGHRKYWAGKKSEGTARRAAPSDLAPGTGAGNDELLAAHGGGQRPVRFRASPPFIDGPEPGRLRWYTGKTRPETIVAGRQAYDRADTTGAVGPAVFAAAEQHDPDTERFEVVTRKIHEDVPVCGDAALSVTRRMVGRSAEIVYFCYRGEFPPDSSKPRPRTPPYCSAVVLIGQSDATVFAFWIWRKSRCRHR